MSAQNEDRATRDLELTDDEADRVKGGVVPVEPGGGDEAITGGRVTAGRKRRRRRAKKQYPAGGGKPY